MAVGNIIVLLLLFLRTMPSNSLSSSSEIISQCACGSARVAITVDAATKPAVVDLAVSVSNDDNDAITAVDCHCRACRKYHVAAFTSYLVVPDSRVSIQTEPSNSVRTYRDSCAELGEVERLACSQCHSKLATRPIDETNAGMDSNDPKILVNMGGLVDSTIPDKLASSWRSQRTPWQSTQQATWTKAQPEFDEDEHGDESPEPLVMTGGCACGQHRYRINYQSPQELQHCYCRLCRQLSGAAFMTWVPVFNEDIEWLTTSTSTSSNTESTNAATTKMPAGEPPLVRMTEHGQRHTCSSCGGVLTIVYDEQPEMTWPAAGGLDDATIPIHVATISQTLCNVMHICCRYRQTWYELPRDGLPRVQEAC